MKKFWREHSLLVILTLLLIAVLILGTWATWHEFATNEGIGMEHHAHFWSSEFLAYWAMQLMMNYAPEIMGTMTIIVLAAKFREKFDIK